ncbi:MAG: DUF1501 domain-containing protein, partial [Verrucomicrobia bacterium]
IVASEFSRDAMMEGGPNSNAGDQATVKGDTLETMSHYGLHRHFTQGSSVLMFGGGVKKGHLHGATADERPLIAVKDPVTIPDLHATIFTAMGMSPKTVFDVEQRPFIAEPSKRYDSKAHGARGLLRYLRCRARHQFFENGLMTRTLS